MGHLVAVLGCVLLGVIPAAVPQRPRLDDPLPRGALVRLGDRRLRHTDGVTAVGFTPDGASLVSAGNDGWLRFWDPATGEGCGGFDAGIGALHSLSISQDGAAMVVGSAVGGLRRVDRKTGPGRRLESDIGAFALHAPGGEGLLIWSRSPAEAYLLAEPGQEPRHSFRPPWEVITAACFARDGARLALAGHKRLSRREVVAVVATMDVASGDVELSLDLEGVEVRALSFDGAGVRLLAGLSDGTVRSWDSSSGQPAETWKAGTAPVSALATSPDGARLVAGSTSGGLVWWSDKTQQPLRCAEVHAGPVTALAFSPDGRLLASGGKDRRVRLWNVATGVPAIQPGGHASAISSVACAPDGKAVFTGGHDGAILAWDAESGVLRHRIEGHEGFVLALAVAPDGRILVSGGYDGRVQVWDARNGAHRAEWGRANDSVLSLDMAPDGRLVASAHADGVVRLWKLPQDDGKHEDEGMSGGDGRPERELDAGGGFAFAVVFSPDGALLATCTNKVSVWDVTDGALVCQIRVDSPVAAMAWSPDGRLLATAGADRTVRMLDPRTGRELARLEGQPGRVQSVAFSPDGRFLASAGYGDARVRIWDVERSRLQVAWEGHDGAVLALAYLPDGRLVSAGLDATALVWPAVAGP